MHEIEIFKKKKKGKIKENRKINPTSRIREAVSDYRMVTLAE